MRGQRGYYFQSAALRVIATLVVIGVLLSGCDDVISIDVPPEDPSLAVYGFFNPDSSWRVSVYRTAGHSESVGFDDVAISNAVVSITGDYGTDTLTSRQQGQYVHAGRWPRTESNYRLDVAAPGFAPVTAADRIPPRPSFEIRTQPIGEDAYSRTYRIALSLTDPPGTNYYRIALYDRNSVGAGPWTVGFFSSTEPFLRVSPATVGTIDIEVTPALYEAAYFDDASFDGSTVEMVLNAHVDQRTTELHVIVTSMSEAYFQYHRTLALQQRNEGDPLSDPVDIDGNVSGGVGVFGAYAGSVRTVFLNSER